jgi:hypothetical protein
VSSRAREDTGPVPHPRQVLGHGRTVREAWGSQVFGSAGQAVRLQIHREI